MLQPSTILPTSTVNIYPTGPWIRHGNRVLLCLAGALMLFAFVPISGAVVAPGITNVEGNYKTVQHLDGGIIRSIRVKNGDRVAAGDVIVELDDTAIRSSHNAALARVRDLLVHQSRLEAERDRLPVVQLPPEVQRSIAQPSVAAIVSTQLALFKARQQSHRGELSLLTQRKLLLAQDINSVSTSLSARRKEAALTQQELDNLRPLRAKGYVNQQRIMPLERENARLEGEVGRLSAELAKLRGASTEADLKIWQSEKQFTQSIADELRNVATQLASAQDQWTALTEKLKNTKIRAPSSGRINALTIDTVGGVVAPGRVLMQVVPDGERLIIDARIPPVEIDKVRTGHAAYVRFPAFNAKNTPRLEGRVLSVTPAQITDGQGQSYFLVQVELAKSQLAMIAADHQLTPGMPAEVYIELTSRTILSYFLKPLTDILAHTFRES